MCILHLLLLHNIKQILIEWKNRIMKIVLQNKLTNLGDGNSNNNNANNENNIG